MDGFHLYFWNSTGEFALETITSLEAIGAYHTWPLLQKAIDQFPGSNVPKDRDKRQVVVGQIADVADKVWNVLDQQFFKYPDNLNQLNMNYVKENRLFF